MKFTYLGHLALCSYNADADFPEDRERITEGPDVSSCNRCGSIVLEKEELRHSMRCVS